MRLAADISARTGLGFEPVPFTRIALLGENGAVERNWTIIAGTDSGLVLAIQGSTQKPERERLLSLSDVRALNLTFSKPDGRDYGEPGTTAVVQMDVAAFATVTARETSPARRATESFFTPEGRDHFARLAAKKIVERLAHEFPEAGTVSESPAIRNAFDREVRQAHDAYLKGYLAFLQRRTTDSAVVESVRDIGGRISTAIERAASLAFEVDAACRHAGPPDPVGKIVQDLGGKIAHTLRHRMEQLGRPLTEIERQRYFSEELCRGMGDLRARTLDFEDRLASCDPAVFLARVRARALGS